METREQLVQASSQLDLVRRSTTIHKFLILKICILVCLGLTSLNSTAMHLSEQHN